MVRALAEEAALTDEKREVEVRRSDIVARMMLMVVVRSQGQL